MSTTKTKKKRRKPPIVDWTVNVDVKWSTDVRVKARTAGEAKRKAWAKYKPNRKYYELLADKS